MLTFPLKKEWYEKIRSGEKTVEYREVKPYWTTRLENGTKFSELFITRCVLRLGYTKRKMTAEITKIEVVDGKNTDLHVDKPVYAIHLVNVVEN